MSLKKLLEKILADGRAEAEAILAEARAEAERLGREESAKAEEIRLEQVAAARRAAEGEAMRLISNARSSARLDALAAKRQIMELTLEAARERMENLPGAEYAEWMKRQILSGLQSGREDIVPAAADRALFTEAFVSELNRESAARGLEANLRLSGEDTRAARGCVLREGGVETNLTLDTLLQQAFKEAEDELADFLFKEEA